MNDPVYFRFLQRRLARRQMLIFAGGAGAAAILAGCGGKSSTSADSGASQAPATPAPVRPAGWHDDSHGARRTRPAWSSHGQGQSGRHHGLCGTGRRCWMT
jgi:hypothetical protein